MTVFLCGVCSIDDVIVYGRNESRLKAHGQNKTRGKLMIFARNFNFLPIQKVYIFVELNFSCTIHSNQFSENESQSTGCFSCYFRNESFI